VVRGRIVDEKAKLSEDEETISTDYTIEVHEIYKQVGDHVDLGSKIVASKMGGRLLLDGHPVQMDVLDRPPLAHDISQVFFLSRCHSCSTPYKFMPVAAISLASTKFDCQTKQERVAPIVGGYCGKSVDDFRADLKASIAAASGGAGH
jgi:hypothetical protein